MDGLLKTSVTAGESGPVIVLAGETDATTAWQVGDLIDEQLAAGTRQLTIDVSQLRFADSAFRYVLMRAARILDRRGGTLALLHPQRQLAQVLALTGADRMLTIHEKPPTIPGPQ